MEIIIYAIYIFHKNVEKKGCRGRNVHFLISTVLQAQEYVLTVASFLLQLAELSSFNRDLMTHKAYNI